MNSKIYVFAFLIALCVACSTDESLQEITETNLEVLSPEGLDEDAFNPTAGSVTDNAAINPKQRVSFTQKTILDIKDINNNSRFLNPGDNNCPSFVAPLEQGGDQGDFLTITYRQFYLDPITNQFLETTLADINCIRQEYFEEFPCLRMSVIQDNNPYTDYWLILTDEFGNRLCGSEPDDTNPSIGSNTPENKADNDDRADRAE